MTRYTVHAVLLALLIPIAGCGGGGSVSSGTSSGSGSGSGSGTLPAATSPTFSVAAGSYSTLQSVTIADATPGAFIYYTTDGSTPTQNSAVYSNPIPIATTTTLQAIAVQTGYTNSPVATAKYTISFPAAPAIAPIADVHQGFIYQIITDRFFNGDTANDNPSESPNLFDANGFSNTAAADWHLYWGGDLAGITQKISYLKSIGAAAIWISPPFNNIRTNAGAANGETGFHGYWTRDFLQIDEHFGDNTNSWAAFDALTAAAHAAGIRVYVDIPANDTNPTGAGENGALYQNGTLLTTYSTDNGTTPFYHHNPNISNYNDRYQLQYYSLSGLADLDQTNPTIDTMLKQAQALLLAHGADGFRFDAVKHTNWGWQYSEQNAIANWTGSASLPTATNRPFTFGEWMEGSGDSLYPDSVKFSNNSGMNLLDYPLYYPLVDVFAANKSFTEIDNTLALEAKGSSTAPAFAQPNDLVTFFDNHDNARLISQGADQMALKLALSFLLTSRGVPIVYYGDEQFLHVDTSGGNDPYNRNPMSSFSSNDATLLLQYLASLRAANPAVAYGSQTQRWVNDDVYIYERQLGSNVVLVAINKNKSADQSISGLYTYLPPGTYADYLAGTMGGQSLTVPGVAGSNNAVATFTLPHRSVSIWIASGSVPPSIGSITPRVANPGAAVSISGAGFGTASGSVRFTVGSTTLSASTTHWADGLITATIPAALPAGAATVTVTANSSTSNAAPFVVNTAPLVPVNFAVSGTPSLVSTDQILLTGSSPELGNWGTTFSTAIGPAPIPSAGSALLTVSVPAGASLQFKFLILHADGSVSWENGNNHVFTAPASGVGNVSVTWQN